ncbi:hypothetical protein QBC45DRAFT_422747 [Copromyces sp. CBS 386.78]|nr:hypothetical protein QBC45DRAFT_422747 [Copromyces sp. CBS 386.78]
MSMRRSTVQSCYWASLFCTSFFPLPYQNGHHVTIFSFALFGGFVHLIQTPCCHLFRRRVFIRTSQSKLPLDWLCGPDVRSGPVTYLCHVPDSRAASPRVQGYTSNTRWTKPTRPSQGRSFAR